MGRSPNQAMFGVHPVWWSGRADSASLLGSSRKEQLWSLFQVQTHFFRRPRKVVFFFWKIDKIFKNVVFPSYSPKCPAGWCLSLPPRGFILGCFSSCAVACAGRVMPAAFCWAAGISSLNNARHLSSLFFLHYVYFLCFHIFTSVTSQIGKNGSNL